MLDEKSKEKFCSFLKRKNVYEAIDTERAYQDNATADMDFDMAKGLMAMNVALKQAIKLNTWRNIAPENKVESIMENLRKIAGVAVAMGERYGMPKRAVQVDESLPPLVPNTVIQLIGESLKPHCCPVCGGGGIVPNGFYRTLPGMGGTTSSISPEPCRSCNGSGVVWG